MIKKAEISKLKSLEDIEVFTLDEAALYLRVSSDVVARLAADQRLPAKNIEGEWRFLKDALRDWLRASSSKQHLLQWAGAFKDDPNFPELMKTIQRNRKADNKRAREEAK